MPVTEKESVIMVSKLSTVKDFLQQACSRIRALTKILTVGLTLTLWPQVCLSTPDDPLNPEVCLWYNTQDPNPNPNPNPNLDPDPNWRWFVYGTILRRKRTRLTRP